MTVFLLSLILLTLAGVKMTDIVNDIFGMIKFLFYIFGLIIAPLFAVLAFIDYNKSLSNFSFIVGLILSIIGYTSWKSLSIFNKGEKKWLIFLSM